MLDNQVDWQELRRKFTYQENLEWMAVIRKVNSLYWMPVYYCPGVPETPFVKQEGQFVEAQNIPGFERYEKIKIPTKQAYDPLQKQVYEVPKYA